MPEFLVTSPDGKKYKVTGPEGATQDQIAGYLAKQNLPQSMQHPQDMGVGERLKTGFMDPFVGAEQLYKHAGGGDAAGYDQYVQERERDIRQRTEGGGLDWARTAGSMANPLNLIPGGAAAKATRPLAKLATGAVGGAVGGATQPITQGDFATEKGVQAGVGGAAGLGLGAVGGLAGKAIPKSGSSVEDLELAAGRGYEALKNSNLLVKEDAITQAHGLIMGQLRDNHFRDYLHPQTFAVMKEIGEHVGPADMGDLKGWQELLKNVGGEPGDRKAAQVALDLFDKSIGNIQPQHVISGDPKRDVAILRKAQADWRSARRSDVVDMSLDRGERQAAKTGSGANQENTVRQRIDAILNSPAQRRMFAKEDIATMEEIVRGTKGINALRSIGKFAPTGVVSSIPTMLGAGAGAAHDPVTGAMIAAGVAAPTLAAKKGAEYLTKDKARRLAETIRSRSPSYVPPAPPPAWQSALAATPSALAPGAGTVLGQPPDDALGPGQ